MMQHIITYEKDPGFLKKILYRKLSDYDINHQELKGLAICHGHASDYPTDILDKIGAVQDWYMVDIYRGALPDYWADASDPNDMAYFPDNYFDYVVTLFCPMTTLYKELQYDKILRNIHRIIKKNGILVITELPSLFSRFLDKEQLKKMEQEVIKIISEKDLEIFRQNYIRHVIEPTVVHSLKKYQEFLSSQEHLDEPLAELRDELTTSEGFEKHKQNWVTNSTEEILNEILVPGTYQGARSQELKKKLEELSIGITKEILKTYGFRMDKIEDELLWAKPINNDSRKKYVING